MTQLACIVCDKVRKLEQTKCLCNNICYDCLTRQCPTCGELSTNDISIRVETLTGKSLLIILNLFDTITNIKLLIQHMEGIPPKSQRLLFHSVEHDNYKTLYECNIRNNSTLHMVYLLNGD